MAAGAALNGRLSGPDAADFDLYLQRRATDGTTWSNVASSTSGGSTEAINATGSSAYRYRWRVYSYEGSGAYTFCSRPK